MFRYLLPLLVVLLLRCTFCCLAAQITIPFLAANASFLDPAFATSSPATLNARTLVVQQPTGFIYSLYNNSGETYTNAIIEMYGFLPFDGCGAYLYWPASTRTSIYGADGDLEGLVNSVAAVLGLNDGGPGATVNVNVFGGDPSVGLTAEQQLTNVMGILGYNPGSYQIGDASVTMTNKGGWFGGTRVQLTGKIATLTGSYVSGYDAVVAYSETVLVLDWGTDPFGDRFYICIDMFANVQVASWDPNLSVSQVSMELLGQSDPGVYIANLMSSLEPFWIQGAIPELLFLYDFSGSNTVPVESTVNQEYWAPDANGSYSQGYRYINQYDAGVAFDLPANSGSSGKPGKPGGGSCGPTSLGMALNTQFEYYDTLTLYNNTMTINGSGDFDWNRATAWLDGNTASRWKFTVRPPFLGQAQWLGNTNSRGIASDWTRIDGILTTQKQPILLRTDFGVSAGSGITAPPGGGHVILLLGKGHSDAVGRLYGLSGDYYIVADPAGHFFGNLNGVHYDGITSLMNQAAGINYGGWFAIYPVEVLQESIIDNKTGMPVMRYLPIQPANSYLQEQSFSPDSFLVTDPLGRETGVNADGSISQNIPESWYLPSVADDEDSGTVVVANGPQTVVVDSPLMGTYESQLTQTKTGPYTVDAVYVGSNDQIVSETNISASVAAGQEVENAFTIAGTIGSPWLSIAKVGGFLFVEWPSAATGFQLQSSTNLLRKNGWLSVTNQVNSFGPWNYVGIGNAPSSGQLYFRLKR